MFVQQLVHAIARCGVRCTPIHPYKFHQWIRDFFPGGARQALFDPGSCPAIRPPYFSASNRWIGPLNTISITQGSFQRAALWAVRRLDALPDAVYGHFLYCGGGAAAWVGRRIGRPSFVAVGEGTFWSVRPFGLQRARRDFRNVTGVIAVSSLLKKKLIAELEIPPEKIGVFPNGIDRTLFFPRSRKEMRERHGFPQDQFLVAYLGNFIPDKGVGRLAEAIDGLDGVRGLFAGVGKLVPTGKNVLFCQRVPHGEVPEILSAADAFVLPTVAEGCCNAIIEALGCGLPIITSADEFNDDLVDDSVSVRVNSLDVQAIRNAIVDLRDDPNRCRRMADAAYARSQGFDINRRADSILSWMESRIDSQS